MLKCPLPPPPSLPFSPRQLEKFVYGKLKQLHALGGEATDPQFCDEIEKYLGDQVPIEI
jgi:hypothetical protein